MKKRLGIIGGGQLGMMITEAAKNLSEHISEIIVRRSAWHDDNRGCQKSE